MKTKVYSTLKKLSYHVAGEDTLAGVAKVLLGLDRQFVGDLNVAASLPSEIWNRHLRIVLDEVPDFQGLDIELMPIVNYGRSNLNTHRYNRLQRIESRTERVLFLTALMNFFWEHNQNRVILPYDSAEALLDIKWKAGSYARFKSETPEEFVQGRLAEILEQCQMLDSQCTLEQLLTNVPPQMLLDWVRDNVRRHTDFHQKASYIDFDGSDTEARQCVVDDMKTTVDYMSEEFIPSLGFVLSYFEELAQPFKDKALKARKPVRRVEKPVLRKCTR